MTSRILLLTLSVLMFNQAHAQETILKSGPEIGEECPAFDPMHVWGPDKGKKACPMCKYGYQQGIMIWLNTDDFSSLAPMLTALDSEIEKKGLKRIRVFVMYMNPNRKSPAEIEKQLIAFATENKLSKVALTYVSDPKDPDTAGAYKINPDRNVKNTVIVYHARVAFKKYINFVPDQNSIHALIESVEKAEKKKS